MALAVFDLDGTLVDTAPDLCASLNACLSFAGMPAIDLDVVRPHAGHGARVMLAKAYERQNRPLPATEADEQLARFLGHYEAHIADTSRPFPGAVAAMDRLTEDGFKLAICTNKTEKLARLLMEALGLAGRFAAICGADTFTARKPDPIHLLGTIARVGFGRRDAVMIGDTSTDTDAAQAARVPSILVDFGYAPDERARREASAVISGFTELDAALCRRLIRSMPD
ncbi:HAD hydrolase-like protein [Aureimonas psammosilenae]|uniref:HAD hydrolase-like protein n=1 Tax=Aureimonas psammosilenae TaxID=2495496 RepID=UPI001F17C016|nr:HAD hydrolase-like protein [Aureimonas psammosilenae]